MNIPPLPEFRGGFLAVEVERLLGARRRDEDRLLGRLTAGTLTKEVQGISRRRIRA
jgi:hypothetical protein